MCSDLYSSRSASRGPHQRSPDQQAPFAEARARGRVWLEECTVLPLSAFIKLSPKMASLPHHKSSCDSQVYIAAEAHMGQETEGGEVLPERGKEEEQQPQGIRDIFNSHINQASLKES
ncbi:hypothetical protein Q7C36_006082 [Tachysurus vachellii]|uniref:Uncharacterized protein n=1 Tax=Tachysurus vachellii TaxID=175792 RepID=A0AA88T4C2_TACVA|nr:hypothetical protein Q7C36_006082 [Tachysurus vachellii]